MSENFPSPILLRGARIVTPHDVLDAATLFVENGRIKLIPIDAAPNPDAARVYDLHGLTLMPGFIDVHIHGALGVDVTSADAGALHRVARYLAEQGTTAWLPTFVPAPDEDYRAGIEAINETMRSEAQREAAARVVGVHYEGPFVNRAQCGALRQQYFKEFTGADELSVLTKLDDGQAVHLTTVAPEIAGGVELVRALAARGWVVAIGHTRAELEALDAACAAGARHVTHLMNAMTGVHHRAPGVAGWALANDDVTCDVIADGVHVDPLVLKSIVRCKTPERTVLISDAVAPTGLGDGEYMMWDERVSVVNGRTRNERGGIAGSVITMIDAVQMMLRVGVPLVDVARMAAMNPARLLRIDGECGTIEAGKRADLVAIDAAGQVRLTMVGGRVAFDGRDVERKKS